MKKPLALFATASMLVPLAACGSDGTSAAGTTTITVANVWDAQHPMSQALDEVFKEQIEESSGGDLSVEIHHGGTLGNESELWDSVRNGSVEAAVIGSGMNQEFPTMLISDWPFLYEDLNHARNVWTGPVAEDLSDRFHEAFPSTYLLSWGPNSARVFSSNRPINEVDDFAGQRIRMPSNPIHLGIAENLGANPQVIPLGDLFTALETGVVDGQDNGMVTLISEALYEVQDYVYETDHIIATMHLVLNASFLDGLDADQQEIVREAASATTEAAWDTYIESVDEDRSFLEENGVTVVQPSDADREEIINQLEPLYDELFDEHDWAEELVADIESQG